ncbi:hypothetical protein Bca52824_051614 [Brassica carinata]|uniref:Replication factor A C-terminal domain-containing protein n=1 Tax=Brassica carinata TaxID=52824 RepID=A0A8X7UJ26_BRACI|nr:hypothetical protein Bca52824_051614 [Brassica carinata]
MADSIVSEVKNLKRGGELMRLNLLIVDLNVKRVLYLLVARDTGLTPAAPLLREIAKVEPVTVAELNSFVTTAVSKDIEFMCTGTVIRPDSEKGWCYIACSKSSRKLKRTESAFTCVRCENYHAVDMLIFTATEWSFVCFDGVMTKLHGLEAHEAGQILVSLRCYPEDSRMPPFVTGMQGKTHTFHVKLTTYDFTARRQSFTVTRNINECEHLPLPDFVDNGGDDNNDQKIHAEVESRGAVVKQL